MPGGASAVHSGRDLEESVVQIGEELGLEVRRQVKVGKRIWGSDRYIDVVLTNPSDRKSIGLECKYQGGQGTAEEKIPATIADIQAWPIRGLVVFEGEGFSQNMRSYLVSTGLAIELEDLTVWLQLFFGL